MNSPIRPLSAELLQNFPNLRRRDLRPTSPEDDGYNCVAFVLGVQDEWFSPVQQEGYYWPADVPRGRKVEVFQVLFEFFGYSVCLDGQLEENFHKIAVYGDPESGYFTHVAMLGSNEWWSSKLGVAQDIEHKTAANLESTLGEYPYGKIALYMKKAVT